MASHDEKPSRGSLTQEEVAKFTRIGAAPYSQRIRKLVATLKGKAVVDSRGGASGYALFLDDGSRAVAYVDDGRLELKLGGDLALIDQPGAPSGADPIAVDLPYASQPNNLAAEVARCHGQPITGVAIGADTFNFGFPEGRELDAMFLPLPDGRRALRVYWEQW